MSTPRKRADGPVRRQLTVQGWLSVVLAAMAVLVLGGASLGAVMLQRTAATSNELVDRISPARVAAARVEAALIDQETGVRGYLTTADPTFVTPYTQGQRAQRTAESDLLGLVDGKQQSADVAAIRKAAADWRRAYAEPTVAGITAGSAAAADSADAVRGKQLFDRVRALVNQQEQHLTELKADRRAELSTSRTVRDAVLIAMVAAFLLTGAVIAVLLRIMVLKPLRTLSSDARRVADGDFEHRISAGGPADLRALAEDVESMRERVVTALDLSHAKRDTLARQAADLDAQALELRRSNAELEQFAYVASHDLQEPLRKVTSFCQLLERRYGETVDDRGKQYIAFAVDGAKRMQILINDLLTFSRVGRLSDAQITVSLAQPLDKALSNLSAAVEETSTRVDLPESMPEITADPTLLTMLWQNLIANAIKFHHPERTPHIVVTCEPDSAPDTWLLSVTDNGIGIPEEFAEKVFVIFQRLHGRDAYSGTGIGLALCKKIVEYQGGKIWIDAAHEGGTRFCFTLPSTPPVNADTFTPVDVTTPEGVPA